MTKSDRTMDGLALRRAGLRATPQRLSVLQAVRDLKWHPSAEEVLSAIREVQPHVAMGTVYNILEALVSHGLIRRIKTECGPTRYDGILETHHHLYCSRSGRVLDYMDKEIDGLLQDYFARKGIRDFKLSSIRLELHGQCASRRTRS